jgi:transposase InsO family protein
MVKATMDIRMKAVLFYIEGLKQASEICSMYGMSDRTLRRWTRLYESEGPRGLRPKKTGPKHARHSIPYSMEERILKPKQKHPSWGARRIKYQYDLPCHWKTVHNVIRRHKMLVRVKPKPQPCKRFQRKHVDSMWQGDDTFQFRISGVGKVYVTGFTDDRSRYRVVSRAYLHKGKEEAIDALHNALKKEGRVPREIYLDNAKKFIAEEFKEELAKNHIKPIYGKPYHPRGRGKIEGYHKILYRELIAAVRFSSLSHFKRELRKFDKRYNCWRKQQIHGWKTPVSIYNDKRYFNKVAKYTV